MTNVELISETLQTQGKEGERLYNYFLNNQLLTFSEWKKQGYSVIKGEKASFKCDIWKRVKNKKYNKDNKGEKEYTYIKKVAHFFTIEQVKPIQ